MPPVFSHRKCIAPQKPQMCLHEADGEALCPDVCELLQLAMLKDFLFKAIKLLSAQIVHRGCSRSVLSALFVAACLSRLRCSVAALSVSSALLCSCYSVLSTLLCVCCSLFCSNSSSCNNSSSSSSSPGRIQSCRMAWPHSSASG